MTPDSLLAAWPALDAGEHPLPQRLGYDRAVWGKLEGSPGDYRWIAASPSFAPGLLQIEHQIQLGTEDVPERATHWRNTGEHCFALVCYPSRATDASGRSAFLEKQILAWRRPAEVPAALGALLLLPLVGRTDDTVWWDRPAQSRWSEDDTLPLMPDDHPLVSISAESLGEAVARGTADLRAALREEALTDLYAHILAGHRAVPLAGLAAPLGPEAVAALLLPLPRALADQLSVAGWLPSRRVDLEALQRSWSVVLGGATLPPAPPWSPSPDLRRQARALAQAILANDPAVLAAPPAPAAARATVAGGPSPIRLAMWGPSSAGKTALLAKLYLDDDDKKTDWDIFPTATSIQFIQDMRAHMQTSNSFPPATTAAAEQIEYQFHHRGAGREASLRLEDRAGSESEKLSDAIRSQLAEAQGLVLVFDPLAEGSALEGQVWRTLEHIHVASGLGVRKDSRPIAVCVSKADVLIETIEDLRSAREDPDGFVRRHDRMGLVRALERLCDNYRLFPVSAAGLRVHHGVIEPVVFYDEGLRPRLCPGGLPLNVRAPFAWLLDQVTNRS